MRAVLVPAVVVLVVAGCSTPAQRQLDAVMAAQREVEQCEAPIAANSRYAVLYQHLPLAHDSVSTYEQQRDGGKPSPVEAEALLAWQAEVRPCRERRALETERVKPEVAAMLRRGYAYFDRVFAALIRYEYTWGNAAVFMDAGRDILRGEIMRELDPTYPRRSSWR